jgi:hypothetical protein
MPVASRVTPVVGRSAYQTTSSWGSDGAARKTALQTEHRTLTPSGPKGLVSKA